MPRIASFCLLLAMTVALSAPVLPVGTVNGAVEDPSRALLAGIRATLTDIETNQNRTAETNRVAYLFFTLVTPVRYRVSAEKAGFKRGTQEILVEGGTRSTADFALELGQITESAPVTGQAGLLETSTAGISRNIQHKVIEDLPLLGRNPLMLVYLSPGITGLIDIDSVPYSSVNGANRRQNEFMLDGIPNNVSDRVVYIPGVDDVEEFTLQTNGFDAEYASPGSLTIRGNIQLGAKLTL